MYEVLHEDIGMLLSRTQPLLQMQTRSLVGDQLRSRLASASEGSAGAAATVLIVDRTLDLATRHLTVVGGTITSDERGSREPGGHDAA